jgi:predicted flap endonuclease-1-like 5' DNA nuclease/flagella basal body P-ring formation protein FlgA
MLSRILPILSLVAAAALAYFLWSSGTLTQMINPQVTTIVAKRHLAEDQRLRRDYIELRAISINDVTPGMITFKGDTDIRKVEQALATQVVGKPIEQGAYITSDLLGKTSTLIVLRANMDISSGDNISLRNVESMELNVAPPRGVIVFDSQEEALLYVSQAYDLAAKTPIFEGQILTVTDTAGGAEKVYIIRASRNFSRAEQFSINGLEAFEISSRDLPRGAVAFPSRVAADVFITGVNRYFASQGVGEGGFITADVLASDGGMKDLPKGDLPRTLAELTAYMQAYPDEVMLLSDRMSLDGKIDPGQKVDMWVEDKRTGGAFGEIELKRTLRDVAINVVYRNDEDANRATEIALGLADVTAEPELDEEGNPIEEEMPDTFSWMRVKPAASRSFRAAQSKGVPAFIVADNAVLVDHLGNGALCLEDNCRVNRSTSEDMKELLERMAPEADPSVGDLTGANPLTIIDGVGPELAASLTANGHINFGVISAWDDAEIPSIAINLDISENLAIYIRAQARTISQSAESARMELGLNEAPEE